MPPVGPTELIVVLIIALVIFGPGKITDIGGALGRGIRDFKRNLTESEEGGSPQNN